MSPVLLGLGWWAAWVKSCVGTTNRKYNLRFVLVGKAVDYVYTALLSRHLHEKIVF